MSPVRSEADVTVRKKIIQIANLFRLGTLLCLILDFFIAILFLLIFSL